MRDNVMSDILRVGDILLHIKRVEVRISHGTHVKIERNWISVSACAYSYSAPWWLHLRADAPEKQSDLVHAPEYKRRYMS